MLPSSYDFLPPRLSYGLALYDVKQQQAESVSIFVMIICLLYLHINTFLFFVKCIGNPGLTMRFVFLCQNKSVK